MSGLHLFMPSKDILALLPDSILFGFSVMGPMAWFLVWVGLFSDLSHNALFARIPNNQILLKKVARVIGVALYLYERSLNTLIHVLVISRV